MQSGWLHTVRKSGLESKIRSTESRVLCEKKLNMLCGNILAIGYRVQNHHDFRMRQEPRKLLQGRALDLFSQVFCRLGLDLHLQIPGSFSAVSIPC